MKHSALGSVFIFGGRGIGLDNYKSKDFMSRPAMGSQVEKLDLLIVKVSHIQR